MTIESQIMLDLLVDANRNAGDMATACQRYIQRSLNRSLQANSMFDLKLAERNRRFVRALAAENGWALDRSVRDEKACSTCQETGMRPSHNGSKRCESGSIASGGPNAHCSCDRCF